MNNKLKDNLIVILAIGLVIAILGFCMVATELNKTVKEHNKYLPQFRKEYEAIMESTQWIQGRKDPGYVYVMYLNNDEWYYRWKLGKLWQVIEFLEDENAKLQKQLEAKKK